MEDERDDDPFDDPFGDALQISSGLQATRDSSAVDDESVGGENAVKGVVERVDVRIRGEFLRLQRCERGRGLYHPIQTPSGSVRPVGRDRRHGLAQEQGCAVRVDREE